MLDHLASITKPVATVATGLCASAGAFFVAMAALTGQELGVEGVMFIEDACEKMGRPLDVVLQELAEARGHGPEQPPPEL